MRLLWNIFCNILAVFLMGCAVAGVAVLLVIQRYDTDLPDFSQLASYDPAVVTRLYANDDRLLAEYAEQRRVYVPLSAIPKRVVQAFISAEDRNFYSHQGIDIYGIGRAIVTNVSNMGQSHALVGGSTITQQVVKNFLLTNEKSFKRKIKEAILAYRISKIYSKDRILELYLNEIYLGRGAYGVASAALTYFNKPLEDLTLDEAAFLAALPKAPSSYEPNLHYDKAKARRDWVIERMEEDDIISEPDARAAQQSPILTRARDAADVARADFFAEEVRRELAALYGSDVLYKGGLYVKTTLDPKLQEYAEEALRNTLIEYDRRHGWRGPLMHLPTLQHAAHAFDELAQKNVPLVGDERLAVVTRIEKGKAEIAFADKTVGSISAAELEWVRSAREPLRVGDMIVAAPLEEKKKQYTLHQIPEVNGALMAMDPHTGRVLAMTGGYSYGGTEFDRATQAWRQPGSAFKPFVYLAALENGFSPSTILLDAPVTIAGAQGMPDWSPENYADEYLGPATMRQGLEKSRNAMTVRLAQMMNLDKVLEVSRKFGIYDGPPKYFSIVLGSVETTLLKLTNAYAILANGGKKVSPALIERIDDRNGKVIYRRDQRACRRCTYSTTVESVSPAAPVLQDSREEIVDPLTNYQIVHMLEGVTIRGTAARAGKVLARPLAGKTGTTNDSRDTWFVGFTPDLVVGVFVGYDQPRTLGTKETGASVALPGFIAFMQKALEDVPSKPFEPPPGIELVQVDLHSGLPPAPGDPGPFIMEAFKPGQAYNSLPPAGAWEAMQPYINPEAGPADPLPWHSGDPQPFKAPVYEPSAPASPPDPGPGGLY